ncbi:TetR/AcrR family transcriptional regulator [Novosphingobium sp. Fuku2-ISO-50]|uniref:TetR/AcrR family transcriptional regulator n=1 Tax=Novosphingobium sp. Fuku2-ISO-50 TaxID=1739114 RepID=UPI00076BD58F|nr:TetR/AcrR family transcriptional regulator [Novosphingobium sp. Fuku2-ISO-50]KUR77077.1 TetR family transcriptional regulator [Novosphingobium sp. Fuku2-ISO-50]
MVTKCRLARSNPDDRRDHIIAVAADVFAEEGYGASSMSTIAARLGGSKATLYKYFSSKEHLFEAVMEQRCQRVLAPLRDLRSSDDDDLESLLTGFGARFLVKIYEPGALDVHRLIQSEGARFPELAAAFFRAGPDAVLEELRATLERFVISGHIVCEDLELAAGQFLGMLRGDRHLRFSTGLLPAPDIAEIGYHARHAARIFVRGLLPRQAIDS